LVLPLPLDLPLALDFPLPLTFQTGVWFFVWDPLLARAGAGTWMPLAFPASPDHFMCCIHAALSTPLSSSAIHASSTSLFLLIQRSVSSCSSFAVLHQPSYSMDSVRNPPPAHTHAHANVRGSNVWRSRRQNRIYSTQTLAYMCPQGI
jgi:hypothetical protein